MKRSGFTLIELLVVIAVIAVLMGILMPALNLARDQGRRMKCASNLKSLATANGLYAANHDDWSVPCMDESNRLEGHSATTIWTGNLAFRQYIGYEGSEDHRDQSGVQTPKKYKCPGDRQNAADHAYNNSPTGTLTSYGYNIEDWFPSTGPGTKTWGGFGYMGYKMSTIKHAAGKLHFAEAHDWWCRWGGANYVKGWDVLGQQGSVDDYKAAGCGGPVLYRHNNAVNLTFYDGHVATMRKEQVWNEEEFEANPVNTSGMWVVRPEVWKKAK